MQNNGFKKHRSPFDPDSAAPFTLSRSKIDLFIECRRCFYLDRRLMISRPSTPPYTLNNAVDKLLKKEFDLLRISGGVHELIEKYKIDAKPFRHPDLATWRDDGRTFIGAAVLHEQTNLMITGIVDDIWIDPKKNLVIVDYKATSTTREITLEDKYKQGYKRQVEIYQWIFRKKGFAVSDTGYFIFANAGYNRPKFDGRLEFELSILPHKGDTSWIEPALIEIKKCLLSDTLPAPSLECEYCNYAKALTRASTAQLKI